MAKFIGEYIAKIDDKGRVIFPAPFKAITSLPTQSAFVVKKDLFENCLQMFTYQEWEENSNQIKSKLNFFNKEHSLFWREYMRDRALVEPDSKLGRITIPKRLLDSIGANKEIVFVGNDHKIEIWAKENYMQTEIKAEDFIFLAQKIMG